MRALMVLCFCLPGHTFGGEIEAPQPGVFHEPATGLTLRYPVELVVRDAQKRIDEGHVAVYGSMETASKEHELARRCLRPILLADLPESSAGAGEPANGSDATLFFFEFNMSKECKAGFKYKTDELVAGGVAQTMRGPTLLVEVAGGEFHSGGGPWGRAVEEERSMQRPGAFTLGVGLGFARDRKRRLVQYGDCQGLWYE